VTAGAGLGLCAIAGENSYAEKQDGERKSHPAAMP
jgi:hypothetical protein